MMVQNFSVISVQLLHSHSLIGLFCFLSLTMAVFPCMKTCLKLIWFQKVNSRPCIPLICHGVMRGSSQMAIDLHFSHLLRSNAILT